MKPTQHTPCHQHIKVGDLDYTAEQINQLLSLIPYKADRKEISALISFTGQNYIGHYPSATLLKPQDRFAWALVGSLSAAAPYFFYTAGNEPEGYTAGWNNMQPVFGTYDLAQEDKEDEITSEDFMRIPLHLPLLTADRAIADEHGNRIADTYETRQAVRNHIRAVYNEQFIENPPLILDEYITPGMLSQGVKDMLSQAGAIINNVPDGEDLTTKQGVLKLSDKPYNPGAYSGLGRVYLRKNLVGGQNLLTQAMVSKPNTIYILQYDYTLDGKSITIPEGCVLDFQGGSFSNGTIVGNNTAIQAPITKIFGLDIELTGTWNVSEAYPEWFGALPNSGVDLTRPIQKTLDTFKSVIFSKGSYSVITLKFSNPSIIKGLGQNDTIIRVSAGIEITGSNYINISHLTISGADNLTSLIHVHSMYSVKFDNVTLYGKGDVGVKFDSSSYNYYNKISSSRIVGFNIGVVFTHNSNANILIDNEFYSCKTCVLIDGCNGNRLIGNTFQDFKNKAIKLEYNGYGSITTGNFIAGNYFEGVENCECDIDFSESESCIANFIVGNNMTYRTGVNHIKGMISSNTILDPTSQTFNEPYLKMIGSFFKIDTFDKSYYNAYKGNPYIGCVNFLKDKELNKSYPVAGVDNEGNHEWREIVTKPIDGILELDYLNLSKALQVKNIVQYYGQGITLGIEAELVERKVTFDSNGYIKYGYNGVWNTIQPISYSQKRPSVGAYAGFCHFDTTLNKPIWWTGTKWVDATGTEV